jgi:hypothetical protein
MPEIRALEFANLGKSLLSAGKPTWSSFGSAASDFLLQWGFTGDINKVNFASPISNLFLRNSYTIAAAGSIGDLRLDGGFDNSAIFGSKTWSRVGLETGVNGTSNYFGNSLVKSNISINRGLFNTWGTNQGQFFSSFWHFNTTNTFSNTFFLGYDTYYSTNP